MRRRLQMGMLAMFFGLLVPAVVLGLRFHRENVVGSAVIQETEKPNGGPDVQMIAVCTDAGPVEMELEAYIAGVVLAEMPESFEIEALKAQAVVARTYALRRRDGTAKHDTCAVCTDPGCCQGYRDPDKGDHEKIYSAVQETAGLVLTYEGQLIDATYFSCSGGSTEDALAVWGSDVPYLQATDSPDEAVSYEREAYFERATFCSLLSIEEDAWDSLGICIRTEGGGVDRMEIGGQWFTGTRLRQILGLPSTVITMIPGEEGMTVLTRGFGHRVGMSQYGADAMAAGGADFREILLHYYQGTELVSWEGEN